VDKGFMVSWFKKKKVITRWKLLLIFLIGVWLGQMLAFDLSIRNTFGVVFLSLILLNEFVFRRG
tara:strand:- start:720 stop:911 length:192 start_codon:yes stop_codon:yes gene_type:complete